MGVYSFDGNQPTDKRCEMKCACSFRTSIGFFQSLIIIFLAVGLPAFACADESATLSQIKQDGKIRLGMYLSFAGLSFKQRGKLTGLEVGLSEMLCDELSHDLGIKIMPEIVNQEWSQIVQRLRDGKYHAIFSALIPSPLYNRYKVRYSRSYLDTGPVICTQEIDGRPAKDVTGAVNSLINKRIVVLNDPAVRRVMRRAGIYVPRDDGSVEIERNFPKSETEAEIERSGKEVPLIPVKEVIQVDEMPFIYKLIAEGAVDAGVIDLGIIWWVANNSKRWSKRIIAFPEPIGKYIYCVITRSEDADLGDLIDKAVSRMIENPRYSQLCKKWHGNKIFKWNMEATDFY